MAGFTLEQMWFNRKGCMKESPCTQFLQGRVGPVGRNCPTQSLPSLRKPEQGGYLLVATPTGCLVR